MLSVGLCTYYYFEMFVEGVSLLIRDYFTFFEELTFVVTVI